MKQGGSQLVLALAAVGLMLAGVVMIFTDVSNGVAFAVIAAGLAMTVVLQQRHGRSN